MTSAPGQRRRIGLLADVAEGFATDQELLKLVTFGAFCTGLHAGSVQGSIELSNQYLDVVFGWHPGYPDPANFGRKSPTEAEIEPWMHAVMTNLELACRAKIPHFVKPHGALFHDLANGRQPMTEAFTNWLKSRRLPLCGIPKSEHEAIATMAGVRFLREGYVERGYSGNSLIPRDQPGAVLTELKEICEQAVQLAQSGVDVLTIHGDNPDCVSIARAVRSALREEGIEVSGWNPS